MSASLSKCYLGMNKMTEYTLKPAVIPGPGWKELRNRWRQSATFQNHPSIFSITIACSLLVKNMKQKHKKNQISVLKSTYVMKKSTNVLNIKDHKCITIIYMTVFGTSRQVASRLYEVICLKSGCTVRLFDAERLSKEDIKREINMAHALLIVTSTAGSGEIPKSGNLLLNELMSDKAVNGGSSLMSSTKSNNGMSSTQMLAGKYFSVLGLGSKAYPLFCAAAEEVHTVLSTAGGIPLTTTLHKVDALENSELSIGKWIEEVVKSLGSKKIISASRMHDVLSNHRMLVQENSNSDINNLDEPLYNVHLIMTEDCAEPAVAIDTTCETATVASTTPIQNDTETETEKLTTNTSTTDSSIVESQGIYLKLQLPLKVGQSAYNVDPGDEVMIYATNNDTDVALAAAGLGFVGSKLDTYFDFKLSKSYTTEDSDTIVPPSKFPTPQTIRTALKRYVAVNDIISFSGITKLASLCPDDVKLQIASSTYDNYINCIEKKRVTWTTIFYCFPSLMGKVSLSMYFDMVPQLRARYYSVAGITHGCVSSLIESPIASPRSLQRTESSRLASTNSNTLSTTNIVSCKSTTNAVFLDILSTKLSYTVNNEVVYGFCSNWLCGLTEGDNIQIKIVRVPKFRLPYDIRSPIICVATGSGIAPIRAMWEERRLRLKDVPLGHKPGPFILLYGCRTESPNDWHFKNEMLQAKKDGIITDLRLALSRHSDSNNNDSSALINEFAVVNSKKIKYVQDIFNSDDNLKSLFLNNAKTQVIVCGGAKMAYSLENAICNMYQSSTARKQVALLKQQGRLKFSVFGSEMHPESNIETSIVDNSISNSNIANKVVQKTVVKENATRRPSLKLEVEELCLDIDMYKNELHNSGFSIHNSGAFRKTAKTNRFKNPTCVNFACDNIHSSSVLEVGVTDREIICDKDDAVFPLHDHSHTSCIHNSEEKDNSTKRRNFFRKLIENSLFFGGSNHGKGGSGGGAVSNLLGKS